MIRQIYKKPYERTSISQRMVDKPQFVKYFQVKLSPKIVKRSGRIFLCDWSGKLEEKQS